MLLKFTQPDMLSTTLVDVATGRCAYEIITVHEDTPSSDSDSESLSASSPIQNSSSSSSSRRTQKRPSSVPPPDAERHRTTITNGAGKKLAHIVWTGRQPEITIGDEKIGGLTDLFGSSSIRFMPKILAIPTRFDTEYIWTATPVSLTLVDYDAEEIRGTFHQDVIRLPTSSKSKNSPSFLHTHIPGVGSNYLEFEEHPLAQIVEIIISFIMMEILRRGRFCLTPYAFQRPKLWQLREARDTVLRRIRRHTV